MSQGLLQGVRVVEFGHFLLVPAATVILADWGADVIKVENHKTGGDAMRFAIPIEGQPPPAQIEPSLWFQYFNRNKRSFALDAKNKRGKEILCELVRGADVFATNLDPAAIENLKVDYDTLRNLSPKLIYCQCTGYGTRGPDKYKPGFDYAAWWARSGMMDRISAPDAEPRPQRPGLGDSSASPAIAGAIAAALFARERTGMGQKVELSLYHFAVWGLSFDIGTALNQDVNLRQTDRRTVTNALWNCYQAKDGKWIMLVMPQTDRYWPSLCRAFGKPEWENDPRYDSHVKRMNESQTLIPLFGEMIASKTATEWERVAEEHDLVLGRIQTPVEVAHDPQAWENDFFTEMETSPGVPCRFINSPAQFSQSPTQLRAPAPHLGQHTEEILQELKYTWDDITELRSQGAIL
jgi:crotonobetainyl-CoA:carnitine CoA-transferase CaiB-like acyl-CoA transferase